MHGKSVQPFGVLRADRIARSFSAGPSSRPNRTESTDGNTTSAQEAVLGSVYVQSRARLSRFDAAGPSNSRMARRI